MKFIDFVLIESDWNLKDKGAVSLIGHIQY